MEEFLGNLVVQRTIIERDDIDYIQIFKEITEMPDWSSLPFLITTTKVMSILWPIIRSMGYFMESMDGLGDICRYDRRNGDIERRYVLYKISCKEGEGQIRMSDYRGADTPSKIEHPKDGRLRLRSVNAEQLAALADLFDVGQDGITLKGDSGRLVDWSERTAMKSSNFDPANFSEEIQEIRRLDEGKKVQTIGEIVDKTGFDNIAISAAQVMMKGKDVRAMPGDIFIPGCRPDQAFIVEEDGKDRSRGKDGIIIRLPSLTDSQLKSIASFLKLPLFNLLNNLVPGQSIQISDVPSLKVVYGHGDECDKLYNVLIGKSSVEESHEAIYSMLSAVYPKDDPFSALIGLYADLALKYKKEAISTTISVYWSEFMKCTGVKAYLSATVMMGSLLEMLTMSWIGDIRRIPKIFNDKVDIPYTDEEYVSFNKDMKTIDSKFEEYKFRGDIHVKLRTCSDLVTHHCKLQNEDRVRFYKGAVHIRLKRNQVHPRKMISSEPISRKEFESLLQDFEFCCGSYVTWTRRR